MHGSALPGSADDRDLVTVQPIGEDDGDVPLQVPRSVMTRIIRARIEETLELVRDRLNKSGYGNVVGKRVVLTGGASQLTGLPEAARRILGAQCAHRPPARRRRPAGGGEGPGLLGGGRPADLSAGGELREPSGERYFPVPDDRNGRTTASRESVVERQFLEFDGDSPIGGRGGEAAGKAKGRGQ